MSMVNARNALKRALKDSTLRDLTKDKSNFDFTVIRRDELLDIVTHYPRFQNEVDFTKLPKREKIKLYVKSPTRHRKLTKGLKVNKGSLDDLIRRKPNVFFNHKWPPKIIGLAGWKSLLRRKDPLYDKLFAENISLIRNQTHVRGLLLNNPRVFRYFKTEDFEGSVFTIKHLALLAHNPFIKHAGAECKVSKAFFEDMKNELMVEILSGKSKRSKQLMSALRIFEDKIVK